jgi:hypothetical protein
MPQFIISATGGNFTSAATWQDSVVPPSATASDIIGLSFSGPLYFDAARTIGDLDLSQFENILGWTASVTITSNAGTFSLGPNMTWLGDGRTGTDANSARLNLSPLSTRPLRITTNGKKIKRIRLIPNPGTSQIIVNDELSVEGDVVMDFDSMGGGTKADYVVVSATAGVPSEIKIDPLDETTNCRMLWARTGDNLGWQANIRIIGTGSGKVRDIGGVVNLPGIPLNATFILEGAQYDSISNPLGMQNSSTFKYVGGTWSGYKRLICYSFYGNNQLTALKDYYVDSPGVVFGIVDLRLISSNGNINRVARLNALDSFKTLNIRFTDVQGGAGTNAPCINSFILSGTASSELELGTFNLPTMWRLGNVAYGEGDGRQIVYFEGGFTYSFERFVHQGNAIEEFGPEATITGNPLSPTFSLIAATGTGNATIRLLRDENTVSGCDIRDIDFTDNPLYAFGSITSNTTGVLTSYPTGGTGGGGEVSFTFLS